MAEKEMCNHHGGLLSKLGILAVVYGVTQYLLAQGWPTYSAWIVGGVLLVLVSWAKKSMMK